MEPVSSTFMAAKEIYEAAKTIQKVYNVSKEMKTVAESEGKDQILAAKDFVGTATEMKQVSESPKGELSSKDSKIEGNLYYDKNHESNDNAGYFVDKLVPTFHEVPESDADTTVFLDKFSPTESTDNLPILQDVNIDRLPLGDDNNVANELTDTTLVSPLDNLSKETKKIDIVESGEASDSLKEICQEGLTDAEKQEIKDKTGWSDKIVDAIRTKEEAQVYIDAELVESEINGKPALIQPQIDGKECNDTKWPDWNNKDLAEEGYPPRDKNGRPYELHHIGQNPDSPLAELTYEQHHSDGNFKVLHTFDESSIDRVQFNKERKEYWAERSKTL